MRSSSIVGDRRALGPRKGDHRSAKRSRGRRCGFIVAVVLLSLTTFTSPAAAAAGDFVDFGGAGREPYTAVIALPDGTAITAGGFFSSSDADFRIWKWTADLGLDQTFGLADGTRQVAVSATEDDRAMGLAVQGDGKIVAAGYVGTSLKDHALVRFNSNGSPDSSFDSDGIVVLDALGQGFSDQAMAVAVDGAGRIVTAGWTETATESDFAVARFNADGTPDSTFGGDGVVTTDAGGKDKAYGLALQPDGKIVAAGSASGNFAVVRYGSDGTLDTTFDGDGIATTDFGAASDRGRDVALDSNDRIVVAGTGAGNWLGIARYSSDGALDTTFSGDGKASFPSIVAASSAGGVGDLGVEVQPDGKPVVGGEFRGPGGTPDHGIARLTMSGALDITFGGDGVVTVDAPFSSGGLNHRGTDIALLPSGDILLSGQVEPFVNGPKPVILRFLGELAASACPGMTITNTVAGTAGDDTLVGTSGSDFIYGLGGNDTITGDDGDDCIYGGTGDDTIDAGGGNDRLFAESGNDILIAGTGLDSKVVGGPGADTIRIAAGDVPASSTELITGKDGNDTIELGAGITNANVTGSPPTFSVADPGTGGAYSVVKVEVIIDT